MAAVHQSFELHGSAALSIGSCFKDGLQGAKCTPLDLGGRGGAGMIDRAIQGLARTQSSTALARKVPSAIGWSSARWSVFTKTVAFG